MKNLNKFSVIIPARNEEIFISKCLEAIKKQDYQGEFETIVIDNGSIDKTGLIAKKYGVIVLRESHRGASKALIKGCCEAKGDILAFTDADTIVPADWLTTYNNIFNSDERIIAAGGAYLFYEKGFVARVLFNKILKPFLMLTLEKTVQKKFPALPSANMAVRKVGYDQAGGFDPSIGWGYDIDLTKKLAERGVIFFDKNFNVETSFRRYYGKSPNNLGAFFRSIKELMVAIYRMMSMHITSKKFSAQEEIRD